MCVNDGSRNTGDRTCCVQLMMLMMDIEVV
jgi:hypothetical protein